MTETEMAEARRLVRFGIAQGWISVPVRSDAGDRTVRPAVQPIGSRSVKAIGGGSPLDDPGPVDQQT